MHVPCAIRRRLSFSKPLILLAFWLTSCGERPDFPRWHQQTPTATEQVVLSDKLTAQDLRQIARAVSGNTSLSSLEPWMRNISDEQLTVLGQLLYDFIFQDALSNHSAVDLLEQRIDANFFGNAANFIKLVTSSTDGGDVFSSAKALLSSSFFPHIVDLNAHWLDLNWVRIAQAQKARLEENPPAQEMPEDGMSAAGLGRKGWVSELHGMLHSQPLDSTLESLSEQIQNTHFVGNTLSYLQQTQGNAKALQALLSSFRQMGTTAWEEDENKSQLMVLFETLDKLNGPTDGLFGRIHEVLDKSDISREIGNLLQPLKQGDGSPFGSFVKYHPLVSKGVQGYIRRGISRGGDGDFTNGSAFWKEIAKGEPLALRRLFRTVFSGVQKVTGMALPPEAKGSTQFNHPIYINSYVITRWLQHAAVSAANTLGKIPEKKFADKVWGTVLSLPEFQLVLTDADGKLTPETKDGFVSVCGNVTSQFERWEAALKMTASQEWVFSVPAVRADFSTALQKAVDATDRTLAFADISAALRLAFYFATQPGPAGKSLLQNLDGNFLDQINHLLASLPPDTIQLFGSLGTGVSALPELVQDLRNAFGQKLSEPPTPRESEIWDALEALATVFSSSKLAKNGFSGAFLAYANWLRSIGEPAVPLVGTSLQLVQRAGMFSVERKDGKLSFINPSLAEKILGSDKVAPSVSSFSHWTPPEIFELERGVQMSLRRLTDLPASQLYLNWLRTIPAQRTESWDSIVDLMGVTSFGLKDEERLWVMEFVRKKGVHRLWQFFGTQNSWNLDSKGNALGLLQGIGKLCEERSLTEPLNLLEQIGDQRLKRIARVLKKWYHTGQLEKFLGALETAMHSPHGT